MRFVFLFPRALQFPPEAWLRISVPHASLTQVTIQPSGHVHLLGLGNTGHMAPSKVTNSSRGNELLWHAAPVLPPTLNTCYRFRHFVVWNCQCHTWVRVGHMPAVGALLMQNGLLFCWNCRAETGAFKPKVQVRVGLYVLCQPTWICSSSFRLPASFNIKLKIKIR